MPLPSPSTAPLGHWIQFSITLCRMPVLFGLFAALSVATAQVQVDNECRPLITRPAYASGSGPRVGIDEAHHNYHTATGRYQPFADLLRRDGYQVNAFDATLTAESLRQIEVLVISNPLNARNVRDWSLPTPSAYTADEVAAVRDWVCNGGSLFLIADHMPFPGAAAEMAGAFGVEFSNGYARDGRWTGGKPNTFKAGEGLADCAITRGRNYDERVTQITTFGGSSFKPPPHATPILIFGPKSLSHETKKALGILPGIPLGTPVVRIEGWCQGAVLPAGRGRVAIFGEAAMFSAQLAGPEKRPMGMNAPDARENAQLLLNLMHWLSRADGMPD